MEQREEEILDSFKCPLTKQIFRDPVILASNGVTYKRQAAEKLVEENMHIALAQRRVLEPDEAKLVSNKTLFAAIEESKKRWRIKLLGSIIQSSDLEGLMEKNPNSHDIVLGQNYKAQLDGQKVTVKAFLTEDVLVRQVKFLQNIHAMPSPRVVGYYGCTFLSDQAGRPSSTAMPNAVITERGHCGSMLECMIRMKYFALRPMHVMEILKQVAEGLLQMHRAGVLHRSLRPSNLQVNRLEEDSTKIDIKIGGLETAVDVDCLADAAAISPLGLLPPEVTQDVKAWSRKGDIWTFGVLAYKLFFGNDVSINASFELDRALSQQLQCGMINPSGVNKPNPVIPDTVWHFVCGCISVQPQERPSLEDVHREIGRMLLQQKRLKAREEEDERIAREREAEQEQARCARIREEKEGKARELRAEIAAVTPSPEAKRQRVVPADEIEFDLICQRHGANLLLRNEKMLRKTERDEKRRLG